MKPECESRQKLLEAASRLIWESSYGSVSVEDICQATGVKKGSFYYFFPSKADLVAEAIERDWEAHRPDLADAFSSRYPVRERISRLAAHIIRKQELKKAQFGKICGCPYFTIADELSTQEEKIRVKVNELLDRMHRYYEALVRDALAEGLTADLDVTTTARELFSYVLGLTLQAKVTNSLQPLALVETGLLRLLDIDPKAKAA